MKSIRIALGLGAASLLLAACGGGNSNSDVCGAAVDAYAKYNQNIEACASSFESIPSFSQSICEEALSQTQCTDSDRSALIDAYNCMGSMDACVQGSEDAFTAALSACAAKADNVSDGCSGI
jgi:hypothetical protein